MASAASGTAGVLSGCGPCAAPSVERSESRRSKRGRAPELLIASCHCARCLTAPAGGIANTCGRCSRATPCKRAGLPVGGVWGARVLLRDS